MLHAGLFYALKSGLTQTTPEVPVPREVVVRMVTAESPVVSIPEVAPLPVTELSAPKPPPKPKAEPVKKKPAKQPPPVKRKAPAIKPTPLRQPKEAPAVTAPAEPPVADVAIASAPAAALPAPVPMPKPAAPPPAAAPKNVSGVEYIDPPQPVYPPIAKRMREEGTVLLRVLINEKGRAEGIEIQRTSGSPRLDEAARLAALRARFKPHLEDGRAIAVYALVPINFSIE